MTYLELKYRKALIRILRHACEMSELMDGPDVNARRAIIDTCNAALSKKYRQVDPIRAPAQPSARVLQKPRQLCLRCDVPIPIDSIFCLACVVRRD